MNPPNTQIQTVNNPLMRCVSTFDGSRTSAADSQIKQCSKCKQFKSISEFYKRPDSKDGYKHQCKVCRRKSIKEYRQTEKGKEANRKGTQRYRQTENGKIIGRRGMRKYRKTAKGKVAKKRFKTQHPNQIKAEKAVSNAIRDGRLPRPDTLQCSYCPAQAEQYHHPSYAPEDRLKVKPVCLKCHSKCNRNIAATSQE